MAIRVIETPLFRVMEDLVSLGGLFELLFGVFIAGIAVRMILRAISQSLLTSSTPASRGTPRTW